MTSEKNLQPLDACCEQSTCEDLDANTHTSNTRVSSITESKASVTEYTYKQHEGQ